jgi:hypothetical protein
MPAPSEARPARNEAPESLAGMLRQLGARAHQLRAATRAADRYLAESAQDDKDTGTWLLASAVTLAADLAADLDGLARTLKERNAEAALQQRLVPLRARAHQLHAAAKAADRFLEEDNRDDQDTGGWLVPMAQSLAEKLAAEIDDTLSSARRAPGAKSDQGGADTAPIEPHDPALTRRIQAATAPLRGAA